MASEPLPSDFMPFGHVVGRVIRAVGDTVADPDSDPEAIPVTGTGLVRFTPLEMTRVVTGTVPSTWVQQETIAADLDSDGFLSLAGARGLLLWPGVWKVSAGSASAFSFPQFTIEVTAAHTADAPLDLWTAAPYSPPSGTTVTTLVVPAGAAAGQILAWDGSQLVWQDAGSGGGGGSQGPQGVSVVSITDTDGDGIATVTLHDPKTGADTTSALPLPRGTDGVSPATPAFTASATTLAAGADATAAVTGTYPALNLALGIPRGADGTGGGGSSLQIVGAGRPDITSTMDSTTQAAVSAATVGTAFISTTGDQGAWTWRKRTSSWAPVECDTGWRLLTPELTLYAGTFKVRRLGTTVLLWVDNVTIASPALTADTVAVTLPSGFRPGSVSINGFTLITPNWWRADVLNNGQIRFPGPMTGIAYLRDTIQMTISEPWPATLPGTAV